MTTDKLITTADILIRCLNHEFTSINDQTLTDVWSAVSVNPDGLQNIYIENGLTNKLDDIYKLYDSLCELQKYIPSIIDIEKPIISIPKIYETINIKTNKKKILKELTSFIEHTKEIFREKQKDSPKINEIGGYGYLIFGERKPIKIGKITSQPYRLLQCLFNPFGVAKSLDSVFESIRENINKKSKSGIGHSLTSKKEKEKLIKNVIKDLQKDGKISGKLKFTFEPPQNHTNVHVELIV